MKNKQISIFILIIVFCIFIFGCDDVATLFHGEKPAVEKTPLITVLHGGDSISNSGDFDFLKTGINIPKSFNFSVKNTGKADLIFNSVEGNKIGLLNNDTEYFSVQLPSLLDTIAPDESIDFEIHFNPAEAGENFSAIVQITTNCKINPVFSFTVFGSGRELKSKIITFTSNNNWNLFNNINNLSYPATIEIFALGAGGGGQGGHKFSEWFSDYFGTGGAGGGGAAAYMKFTANENIIFNITVGSGGNGGSGVSDFGGLGFNGGGYPGSNGNTTSVTGFGGNLIVAGGSGGYGGGTNRKDLLGGSGGVLPVSPSNISSWIANPGKNGGNGEKTGDVSRGGDGGVAIYNAGKGGRGGYGNAKGGDGENGRVIIEVTWYE